NDLQTNLLGTLAFALIGLLTVVGVVLINEGQRRIPVHHAKRVRGNRQYGGSNTNIPLKVNTAGMIPVVVSVSIMVFPGMVANFLSGSNVNWVRNLAVSLSNSQSPDTVPYNIIYFFMVIGFTFFYTVVVFQQQRIPESLQRQGAFIPGVRPGRNTAVYLQQVLTRRTFVGALFLGVIAFLPYMCPVLSRVHVF